MMEKEFKYFLDNKKELSKKYNNKFIVIKNEKVIGSYNNEEEAYSETKKEHELGTFLIQKCSTEEAAYIQTFHSRAIF